jgi:hypothetical protein
MTTYAHTLRKDGRTRQFEIRRDAEGWRVVDRADATVLREAHYSDWHRVERARRVFAIECSALEAEGWIAPVGAPHSTNR